MLELEQDLATRLRQRRVQVETPDDDTLLCRRVPTNARFFNKPRTNLLIKRPHEALPFIVCIDEDLEYTGADGEIARLMAGGYRQQGWRVLTLGFDREVEFQSVIEAALGLLGFDGREPHLAVAEQTKRASLLARFGINLTKQANEDETVATVGRNEDVEDILGCLFQWQAQLAILVGEPGVGKSDLLRATARRLHERRPEFQLIEVNLGAMMVGTLFDAERENLLAALLGEATKQASAIVAMEHAEMGLINVPRGALLLEQALDNGAKLLATTLPGYVSRFMVGALARRAQVIELNEMTVSDTEAVLLGLRERLEKHHRVCIDEAVARAAVEIAGPLEGRFPAQAIALLDKAAARAALTGATVLSEYDIFLASMRMRKASE